MTTDLPHVARVAIEGTFDSERFVNIMHFYKINLTGWSTLELADLLGILDDAGTDNDSLAHLYEQFDTGLAIDTLTATTLDTTTPFQVSTTVAIAGTNAGNNVPPMLAAVVKWGTAVASRKYRGRTFFTGLNVNFISGTNADRLDTTRAAALATEAEDFVTAWAANPDIGFCVLSQTDRLANNPSPFGEIISSSVNPLICVQRRRRERP